MILMLQLPPGSELTAEDGEALSIDETLALVMRG